MRSSKQEAPASRGRAIAAKVAKALAFVALLVLINVGITLALEPYGTAAEVTWHDYRLSADEDIDTLIVGSSFSQRNADPYALDEMLGSNSFSLSTPAQSLTNALAALETAAADHDIKRAIIFVGPESFQTEPWFNAQVTFMQAKSQGESIPSILRNVGRLAFDETNFANAQSLTWMLPWCYSSVGYDIDAILNNINNRLEYPNPIDAASVVDPTWHYMGKGHGGYEGRFNRDLKWVTEVSITNDAPFLPKNISDFVKLLDFAESNGIQLYVGIAPRPEYSNLIHQSDGYQKLMSGLKELTEEHGGVYYDFNLTRPEFYRPEEDEFSDSQHLNIEGGEHLCRALGTLISEQERGEDVSSHFFGYDDWDAYLASYDPVEYVYFTYELDYENRMVEVTAHSISRPEDEIEYKYDLLNPIGEREENVRPYDTDPTYRFSMHEGHGDVRLRLHSRPVGSSVDAVRTFQADIFY